MGAAVSYGPLAFFLCADCAVLCALCSKYWNWIKSQHYSIHENFGKTEREKGSPLLCPQCRSSILNLLWRQWICCKEWLNKRKLIEKDQGFKSQDEEKKGKNIDGEAERWEIFSFILEIYNLYFSIFQDILVVLLMNFSSVNLILTYFKNEVINLSLII